MQKLDIGILKELIHSGITHFFLVVAEGEAGQNLFLDIVIAVAGIYAVVAFNTTQRAGDLIWIFQSIVIIVEDVPRDYHQIRILGIDLPDHLGHLRISHAVAQVEIRYQDDFHGIQIFARFLNGYGIICGMYLAGI